MIAMETLAVLWHNSVMQVKGKRWHSITVVACSKSGMNSL